MELPVPPGPPAGRRDNGLPSADWGALVDLDPRLSEGLLGSLASAQVAAFVEPAAGSHAFTRAAQLPDRPLHRLWVDPAKADTARAVVAAEVADLSALLAEAEPGATAHGLVQAVPRSAAVRVLPPPVLPGAPSSLRRWSGDAPAEPADAGSGPASPSGPVTGGAAAAGPAGTAAAPGDGSAPPTGADEPAPPAPAAPPPSSVGPGTSRRAGPGSEADEDEAWRQIVAGYGKEVDGPVPPWPVSEDVDPPRGRSPLPSTERPGQPPRRRRTDPPPAELPGWVEPAALEDDGHYVPPPPPPVPRLAPRTLAAALTLLAGLLLMFAPGLLLQPRTAGVGMFGVLLTVGGAAALVWLMRDAPPTDSGPDDGAVV